MLTIHAADLLLPGPGRRAVAGGAVLVRDGALAAVGPYEDLAAGHPTARVRRWPGLLTPGLVQPQGSALLERAYHPDPRESDALGTEPLTGAALNGVDMDDSRWGASARRGVQRMLAHGTVAVVGPLSRPAVADAVQRSGMRILGGAPAGETGTRPSLDPLAWRRTAAEAFAAPALDAENRAADFAVFDAPDEETLLGVGAACCVVTVLGGRMVHRRR
ncbi:amidohydrolase family protein [Streptomyces sp. NPDC002308]